MRVPSSSLPPSSSSPPPLAPFLWLYEASSTLAARALMSGPSARADWPDARVRESGSRVWLSSYSGNRASNPREGQRSGARGRAWVPPPPDGRGALLCGSAARVVPSVLPGLSGSRGAGVPPSTFPAVGPPPARHRPPPHARSPGNGHQPQQTGSESASLSNQAACPLPTIYRGPGRRRLSPSPLPTSCPSPSRPQFPVRGRDDRKPEAHPRPPFSRAGRGASAALRATAPTLLPRLLLRVSPSPSRGCAGKVRTEPAPARATSGRVGSAQGWRG